MGERLIVEIGDADIDIEIIDRPLDLLRCLGQHRQADIGMLGMEGGGETRNHGERGGDRTDPQMPAQPPAHLADLLLQPVAIGEDALGPFHHAKSLGREALEAPAALHDGHGKLGLELLDRRGESRLGDAASGCGAAEMAFPGQCPKIDQLAKKHGPYLTRSRKRRYARKITG